MSEERRCSYVLDNGKQCARKSTGWMIQGHFVCLWHFNITTTLPMGTRELNVRKAGSSARVASPQLGTPIASLSGEAIDREQLQRAEGTED
jgi:hypothetical protein